MKALSRSAEQKCQMEVSRGYGKQRVRYSAGDEVRGKEDEKLTTRKMSREELERAVSRCIDGRSAVMGGETPTKRRNANEMG